MAILHRARPYLDLLAQPTMSQVTLTLRQRASHQRGARQLSIGYREQSFYARQPPPGNSIEADIFATSSVKTYIAIVSRHKFASGNWREYQSQDKNLQGFSCSTNEILNPMLRPLEAEQTVLIFKRKKS